MFDEEVRRALGDAEFMSVFVNEIGGGHFRNGIYSEKDVEIL